LIVSDQRCNRRPAKELAMARNRWRRGQVYRLPHGLDVEVPSSARIVLMLMVLGTSASRLHGHALDAPDQLTREVNGCLRLVRIAASRREPARARTAGPAACGRTRPI
jgi:hypothetical protein